MSMKYIRENKNSFAIYKGSKNYGKFQTLDDAVFARNLLVNYGWNLHEIPEIIESDGEYVAVKAIDGKLHILGKFPEKPSPETVERLAKERIRNPNGSKYGLNITRVFDTFVIKKRIAGEDEIFGYYDSLDDAKFARNFLMDHSWNVDEFSQIEYDEDLKTYRVIEVIDGKAYVLDNCKQRDEIDLKTSHEEFLAKISKHRYGLAEYPHLDDLKTQIPQLEERFDVEAKDENWSFDEVSDPLADIVFNLTPWQKIVYDSIDGEATFDEIRQSLIRYKSKNFDEKIQRNLDELVGLGLVRKNQNCFEKTNF